MTEIGRMSKQDLDRLGDMGIEERSPVLRDALGFGPAMCLDCGARTVGRRRAGTSYVGRCHCGGQVELVDHS